MARRRARTRPGGLGPGPGTAMAGKRGGCRPAPAVCSSRASCQRLPRRRGRGRLRPISAGCQLIGSRRSGRGGCVPALGNAGAESAGRCRCAPGPRRHGPGPRPLHPRVPPSSVQNRVRERKEQISEFGSVLTCVRSWAAFPPECYTGVLHLHKAASFYFPKIVTCTATDDFQSRFAFKYL